MNFSRVVSLSRAFAKSLTNWALLNWVSLFSFSRDFNRISISSRRLFNSNNYIVRLGYYAYKIVKVLGLEREIIHGLLIFLYQRVKLVDDFLFSDGWTALAMESFGGRIYNCARVQSTEQSSRIRSVLLHYKRLGSIVPNYRNCHWWHRHIRRLSSFVCNGRQLLRQYCLTADSDSSSKSITLSLNFLKKMSNKIRFIKNYFLPFWKYGCLKQCSLLDLLVLWKSYIFSYLMKDEKLLCLKKRGSIVSENSFCFLTTKDSPSGDHPTMWSYFLSYALVLDQREKLTSTIS